MKVWAIGFKQHVELRKALHKPVAEVTQTSIPPQSALYKTKFKIRVVHHKGGKVIKTLKGNYAAGLFVGEGECVEMPAYYARQVLKG